MMRPPLQAPMLVQITARQKKTSNFPINDVQSYLRRVGFINEIRVENVEFIALDDLGRRVVVVVMRLIVFVPFETGVNPIEISVKRRDRFMNNIS